MAQPLLHHRQHLLVAAAFGVDQRGRGQGRRQRRPGANRSRRAEAPTASVPGRRAAMPARNRVAAASSPRLGAGAGLRAAPPRRARRRPAAGRPHRRRTAGSARPPLPRRFDRRHLGAQGGEALGTGREEWTCDSRLSCSFMFRPHSSESSRRRRRDCDAIVRIALKCAARLQPMTLLRCFLLAFVLLAAMPLQAAGDADWLYRGSDIPRDPAWRFGTLPNGLRYAVRRNALPAGRSRSGSGSTPARSTRQDNERGWAHFVEHLAFRGTKSFGDREARQIWQKLGASFGSDTNATHQRHPDRLPARSAARRPGQLDTSLNVLAEMVDTRPVRSGRGRRRAPVVLQEKGRRPELTARMMETSLPLFYGGLNFAERDTIGTDATLNAADRARPARLLRALVPARPDDRRDGRRRRSGDDGGTDRQALRRLAGRADARRPSPITAASPGEPSAPATLAYPGAPHVATVMWLRPFEAMPHTIARERDDLARSLGASIINRRLEAHARGESALRQCRRRRAAARPTSPIPPSSRWPRATATGGRRWPKASRSSATRCARRRARPRSTASSRICAPPPPPASRASGPRSRSSRRSSWSARSTTATSSPPPRPRSTFSSRLAPLMTPQAVGAAMRDLFTGAGPRMMLLSPQPIEGGDAGARRRASPRPSRPRPAVRQAERKVSFDDLPPLGPPGREVSRQRIEDLDVTIVRFANGSTLTFKQTDFERGSVAGPAALRRRHCRPARRPAHRRPGWPGWSGRPASPISTSTGWSGC